MIGKVCVHFEQNKCTVHASIVPEHWDNDTLYEVSYNIVIIISIKYVVILK